MKHQPTKRRRSAALLALLSSLVLSISLLGVSGAVAHSRDHRPYWHIGHGWPTPPSDQALALEWFDLTNQTVSAAGFPEPVTQSRTWAVSWITAIRTGSVDPDPTWTPLWATPRHPEYPSGHAGYAGAAEGALTALTGPWTPAPIPVTSTTDPGSVHTYTRWSQITQETIDGRVWEGVHYRFSDETAAKVGKQVAAWDLPRLYRLGL